MRNPPNSTGMPASDGAAALPRAGGCPVHHGSAARRAPAAARDPRVSRSGIRAARRTERALLRAANPVLWWLLNHVLKNRRELFHVPGIGYVVCGAVASREAMLAQDVFTKDGDRNAGALMTEVLGPTALLNMDGERHLALRRRLQDLFTPRFIDETCTAALADLADEVRTRLAAGEELDVAYLARRCTGTMMCHLLGLGLAGPELEWRAIQIYDLGIEIMGMVPLRVRDGLNPDHIERARKLFDAMVEGVDEVYATGSDTTIPGRLRNLGLSLADARAVIGMLLIVGTETTSTAFARITNLLAVSGQWDLLQADRSLLQAAIDEGLRYTTPAPASTRTTRDGEFRGRRIRGGRSALIVWSRAMRDPAVIDRGDEFDITRTLPRPLRQLWYGAGAHFCLGFALANRELQVMLGALLDGAARIEVTERVAAHGVLLPTWTRLVVRRA